MIRKVRVQILPLLYVRVSAGFRGIGVIIIRVYGADMKVVFSIIRGCIRCFIFMGRFSAYYSLGNINNVRHGFASYGGL